MSLGCFGFVSRLLVPPRWERERDISNCLEEWTPSSPLLLLFLLLLLLLFYFFLFLLFLLHHQERYIGLSESLLARGPNQKSFQVKHFQKTVNQKKKKKWMKQPIFFHTGLLTPPISTVHWMNPIAVDFVPSWWVDLNGLCQTSTLAPNDQFHQFWEVDQSLQFWPTESHWTAVLIP